MLELIIIPIVTGIAVTVLSAIVLRYLDRKSHDNETRKLKQ
jgi:capsular polysaccharide biosynthesis protein